MVCLHKNVNVTASDVQLKKSVLSVLELLQNCSVQSSLYSAQIFFGTLEVFLPPEETHLTHSYQWSLLN